ncbi:MAG: zinc ribbon domain-containing protein [Kiloniellales bacterium]
MSDYAALQIPGPTETALSAPFWQAAAEGKLLIQHCGACDRAVFYPRPLCPHCWADALAWRQASGQGRLASFSEVWKPGHPGWLPVAPFVVGLVGLDEGATMLSHILCSSAPKVGAAVRFRPTEAGGRRLPFFELIA